METRFQTKPSNERHHEVIERSRVVDRYGEAGKAGWSPLPDVLLFNQKKLGLISEDLNVLLNLMAHYYEPGEMPFVRPSVIAQRMGVSPRSVQRSIARLREKKLILKKYADGHVVHDLTPLIAKLQPLAKHRMAFREYRQANQSSVAQLDRAPDIYGHSSV
jgi:DNA replication protein DnaD